MKFPRPSLLQQTEREGEMQEKKPVLPSTSYLLEDKNSKFLEIFTSELSRLIISLLRGKGFFVLTYFDINTGKRRILVSINQFKPVCSNRSSNSGSFISIEIKSGTQKNQNGYKKSILKSGGLYLWVHSLSDFYRQFESITGEIL